jgi:predicted methyltransferase
MRLYRRTHTQPPPILAPGKRAARRGKTDQFLFRFRKPG